MTAGRGQETGITCIRLTGTKVQTLNRLPSQSNAARLPNCFAKQHPAKKHRKHRKKHRHAQTLSGRKCRGGDCEHGQS